MDEDGKAGEIAILERLLDYARKVFSLESVLSQVADSRQYPQISTLVVVKAILAMQLARLGSLNAIEQLKGSRNLRNFLKAPLPSADTLGRVASLINSDTIRSSNHRIYERLKRNKALAPAWHGLMALAVDGHESHSSFRRCCDGCLERKVGEEKRIQYYHRNVTAQLIADGFCFMLDAEPQRPGEDEVAAAIRLLERLIANYPRAFDVVLADALYARSSFFEFVTEHNKDVIVVLKENCPELLADATYCFRAKPPTCVWNTKKRKVEGWDEEGFESGPQIGRKLRVVKSHETKKPVRRQLNKELEEETSSWMWVTTLSPHRACTEAVVALGHARWCIENQGFNELGKRLHADHVYKHGSKAILNFWLMSLLSSNIFQAFYLLNLKPAFRKGKSMIHFACMMAAQLYSCLPAGSGVPP